MGHRRLLLITDSKSQLLGCMQPHFDFHPQLLLVARCFHGITYLIKAIRNMSVAPSSGDSGGDHGGSSDTFCQKFW